MSAALNSACSSASVNGRVGLRLAFGALIASFDAGLAGIHPRIMQNVKNCRSRFNCDPCVEAATFQVAINLSITSVVTSESWGSPLAAQYSLKGRATWFRVLMVAAETLSLLRLTVSQCSIASATGLVAMSGVPRSMSRLRSVAM